MLPFSLPLGVLPKSLRRNDDDDDADDGDDDDDDGDGGRFYASTLVRLLRLLAMFFLRRSFPGLSFLSHMRGGWQQCGGWLKWVADANSVADGSGPALYKAS